MEYEVLLLQFLGRIVVTLKEAQDGHVVQGVGGGVGVVHDWKVLSFVANRVQVLYKAVSEPQSLCDKRQHLPVANHFNSPSHSLDNMSILGLLQCHNDATQKVEEQHLIF
eukprot:g17282.t1